MINAFVMFTSGLVIDIKALWGFFKVHFKWAVLIGKLRLRIEFKKTIRSTKAYI